MLEALMLPIFFATVVAALIFAALMMRDLSRRKATAGDRSLAPGEVPAEAAPVLPRPEPNRGRMDRAFYDLVMQGGAVLDERGAMIFLIGGGLIGLLVPLVLLDSLLGAALGLVLGMLVPLAVLNLIRWRRLRKMQNLLPESLQMIADNIRAGRTLEQSAEAVSREMPGPLGDEFGYLARQMRLGHSPIIILERIAQRVPLHEFRIFCTAVTVHRRSGGNLAMLADRLATAARDRQHFMGHLNSVTAGGRLSAIGLVVAALAAVAIIAWLQPDYLSRFLTSPIGPTLLMISGGLQLVGAFWIWRILRVTY